MIASASHGIDMHHIQTAGFFLLLTLSGIGSVTTTGQVLDMAENQLRVCVATTGLIGPPTVSLNTISASGPGFSVAFDFLRQRHPNMTFIQTFLYDRVAADCPGLMSVSQDLLAKWYYRITMTDKDCQPVIVSSGGCDAPYLKQLATAWDVLLITTGSSDLSLRKSPTWISTNPLPTLYYEDLLSQLVQTQAWKSVFVVLDQDATGFYSGMATVFNKISSKLNLQTVYVYMSSKQKFPVFNYEQLLDKFSGESRVLLFLGFAPQFRLLLIAAHHKRMIDENYVYISIVPYPNKFQGLFTWNMNDTDDEIVRTAYQCVLFINYLDITQNTTASMQPLVAEWQNSFRTTPFYEDTELKSELAIPGLASANAAIEILGQVLSETMANGYGNRDWRKRLNGRYFKQQSQDRTFDTRSGKISLDMYGSRTPSSTVSYFDYSAGQFNTFMESDIKNGSFHWIRSAPVAWFNQSQLPPNKPYCGYLGDAARCWTGISTTHLTAILVLMAVISLCSSLFLIYILRAALH